MLHPSTKKLIDRLCEMTLQRKIDWASGDTAGSLAYDTEGYRVVLEGEPACLILCDALGNELERASIEDLETTRHIDGGTYDGVIETMRADAARIAMGTENAIASVLDGLSLDDTTDAHSPSPVESPTDNLVDQDGLEASDAVEDTIDEMGVSAELELEDQPDVGRAVADLANQVNSPDIPEAQQTPRQTSSLLSQTAFNTLTPNRPGNCTFSPSAPHETLDATRDDVPPSTDEPFVEPVSDGMMTEDEEFPILGSDIHPPSDDLPLETGDTSMTVPGVGEVLSLSGLTPDTDFDEPVSDAVFSPPMEDLSSAIEAPNQVDIPAPDIMPSMSDSIDIEPAEDTASMATVHDVAEESAAVHPTELDMPTEASELTSFVDANSPAEITDVIDEVHVAEDAPSDGGYVVQDDIDAPVAPEAPSADDEASDDTPPKPVKKRFNPWI